MTDDEYFTRQFGPYGARRAVPVARRNRKSKSKFGKPYAPRDLHPEVAEQFSIVAKLAQAKLAAVPGCDIGEAMRAAWNEHRQTDVWKAYSAKRKAAAKSNPWYDSLYLPDTTIVRSSLVEAPYEYDDPTAVHSDLVPGPYGRTNPADDCIVRGSKRSAKQERARAVTFDQRVLAAEDRESGVAELVPREEERARGVTGTRHRLDFSPDNQSWPYHPMYEQMDGQFSTGEQFTRGYQPMNRRNPAGDVMTSRFPGKCCICGGEIARGEQMYIHPTMRGPKGGKQKAHVNCGR